MGRTSECVQLQGLRPCRRLFPDGRRGHRDGFVLDGQRAQPDLRVGRRRQFARYHSQQRLRPLQLHFPQHLVVPQGQDAARSGRQLYHPERPQHGQSGRLFQPAGLGLPLPARRRLGGCRDVRTLQLLARHLRTVLADDGRRYLSDAEPLLDQLPQPARDPQGPLHDQRLADLRHPRLALGCGPHPGGQLEQRLYREALRIDQQPAHRGVAQRSLRHHQDQRPSDLRRRDGQYQQELRRELESAGQRRRFDLGHALRRLESPRPDRLRRADRLRQGRQRHLRAE